MFEKEYKIKKKKKILVKFKFYNKQILTHRNSSFSYLKKRVLWKEFVILYFLTELITGNSSSSLCTVNLTLKEQKMYKIMCSYLKYQLQIVDQIKFKQKQSPNCF